MTAAQIVDFVLKDYLNVGSDTVQGDLSLRQRAERWLNNTSQDAWSAAPWWWKLGSDTVSIAAGANSGVCPVDFDGRFGTQGGVFVNANSINPGPQYAPPAQIAALRNQVIRITANYPYFYSLFGRDDTTFMPLLQVYPTAGSAYTLNLTNYIKSPPELIDKPTALTATADAAVGLLSGAYLYAVTFVTASGETEAGVSSQSVTVTLQNINLTGIPVSQMNSVTGRNIYRTVAGGSAFKLAFSITNNTATTATDSTLDGALGVAPPTPDEAITGTEDWPDVFHSGLLLDGLIANLATFQGDLRDKAWKKEWREDVKRQFSEFKQGQNQTQVMPRFGVIAGYNSGPWYRWKPIGS